MPLVSDNTGKRLVLPTIFRRRCIAHRVARWVEGEGPYSRDCYPHPFAWIALALKGNERRCQFHPTRP